METGKVLEMFACVDRDLGSLQVIESGYDNQTNRESES